MLDGPPEPLTAWQVIWWWEARRILYNGIVGIAGAVTSVMLLVAAALWPHSPGLLASPSASVAADVFAAIIYGIVANLFYTGGWVIELIVRRAWPEAGAKFARIAFTLGTVFSVGVTTLIPILAFVSILVEAGA